MSLVSRRTFNIVRQVNLDTDTLKKVAEALGIPASEHDRIISISGEIQIAPAPSRTGDPGASSNPAGGSTTPTSSGNTPRS
jgi:hypothetical protein